MGFKVRDADKTRTGGREFRPYTGSSPLLLSSAIKTVPTYDYYFGEYKIGPLSNYSTINQFFNRNQSFFPDNPGNDHITNDPNHWDISARVWAGYVMNTITFGNVRLQGGLRFEGTQDSLVDEKGLLD